MNHVRENVSFCLIFDLRGVLVDLRGFNIFVEDLLI